MDKNFPLPDKLAAIAQTAILFIVLLSSCNYQGQYRKGSSVYYVHPGGNDSLSGLSESEAWRTVGQVNRHSLQPGDKVLFYGGSAFNGTLRLRGVPGKDSLHPTCIGSYGKGLATINGDSTLGIWVDSCENIVIKALKICGSGRKTGNQSDGLHISNSRGIVADSLEVWGFQHSGVAVFKCQNVRLTRIDAHDNGFAGIHVFGTTIWDTSAYDNTNIYIGYCRAINNPGDPTVLNNHSGNGILASSISGGVIEFCEASDNGWDMPWRGNGPVGIWIWDCTRCTIRYCISHHNKTAPGAADGGGFDLDGGVSHSIISCCLSYGNQGAGIGLFEFGAGKAWRNNIIQHNLSINDGTNGTGSLAIWKGDAGGSISHCLIRQNTFVNENGANIHLMDHPHGFVFSNNLFVYSGDLITSTSILVNETFHQNRYWEIAGRKRINGFASLAEWAKRTGNEWDQGKVTGTFANPNLPDHLPLTFLKPVQLQQGMMDGFLPASGSCKPLQEQNIQTEPAAD